MSNRGLDLFILLIKLFILYLLLSRFTGECFRNFCLVFKTRRKKGEMTKKAVVRDFHPTRNWKSTDGYLIPGARM